MHPFRSVIALLAVLYSVPMARAQEADVWQDIRVPYRPLAQLLADTPAEEPTAGNTVEILRDGEYYLGKLVQDILDARSYVHMEYFEYFKDYGSRLVRTALMLKGLDSLEVRYIEEDLMNFPNSNAYFNQMRWAGVEVEHYSFFWCNRRNHQKIVTIDDTIAYTGGMNIGNHYFYEWDDTHLRLTGPCVRKLEELYALMWQRMKGKPSRGASAQVVPEVPAEAYRDVTVQMVSDEPDHRHQIMEGYLWLLENCQDYLYIETPYFTPPKVVHEAMKKAVARGLALRPVQLLNHIAKVLYMPELVGYQMLIREPARAILSRIWGQCQKLVVKENGAKGKNIVPSKNVLQVVTCIVAGEAPYCRRPVNKTSQVRQQSVPGPQKSADLRR